MILKFSCEEQVREKLGKYEWCNNKTSHTSLNLLHFCEEKNTSNKDIFSWQLGKLIESVSDIGKVAPTY